MKNSINIFKIFIALAIFGNNVAAQSNLNYPEVGKPCPEFTLNEVLNYPKKQVSLSDLKGKYIILDFWQRGCLACISGFPKLNNLHKQFKDKVVMIAIGEEDKENMIRPLFERLKKKGNYQFPAAFDSAMVKRFVHQFFPTYVWIDKNGTVSAVTWAQDLTVENVQRFVSGEKVGFIDRSHGAYTKNKNVTSTLMPTAVSKVQYLTKSELYKWQPGMPVQVNHDIMIQKLDQSGNLTFQTFHSSLIQLYKLAYWGRGIPKDLDVFENVVLEVADSLDFFTSSLDESRGFYSYSLSCAAEKMSRERAMNIMQGDLDNVFPYVAEVVLRMMPCYELRILDKSKVRLLNEVPSSTKTNWGNTGGIQVGISIEKATSLIGKHLPDNYRVFNETGIKGNVNLKLDADLWDLADVRTNLRKQGLDLFEVRRLMRVLVIRDRLPTFKKNAKS